MSVVFCAWGWTCSGVALTEVSVINNNEVKQDRQCTYEVMLRRVCESLLQRKSNKYYIFLCVCQCVRCAGAWALLCACARSLSNSACDGPPHCHLRPLWLEHIFQKFLIHGTIFGKKLLVLKCVFWFSLHCLFETFLIIRRTQRVIVINLKSLHVKIPLFFSDFNKTCIFSIGFREKSWNIKFY